MLIPEYKPAAIVESPKQLKKEVASSEAIFTPCLVSASQYIAGASLRYPAANLIAAQRDYFGNHGFWSIDDPNGETN